MIDRCRDLRRVEIRVEIRVETSDRDLRLGAGWARVGGSVMITDGRSRRRRGRGEREGSDSSLVEVMAAAAITSYVCHLYTHTPNWVKTEGFNRTTD